jgi:hypothetical protein
MRPVRLRYLSPDCHDDIVELFARACPVALSGEDADVFFALLCRRIDREIARAVTEMRKAQARPPGAKKSDRQKTH